MPLRDILVPLGLALRPLIEALVPLRVAYCSDVQKNSEAQYFNQNTESSIFTARRGNYAFE